MPTGVETAASVATLIIFVNQLATFVSGLREAIPDLVSLVDALESLHDVLDQVKTEYTAALDVFEDSAGTGFAITSTVLDRQVNEITEICTEYEGLLRKIKDSRSKRLAWRRSAKKRVELNRKLDEKKATLTLLHQEISEERQRVEELRRMDQPPPYAARDPNATGASPWEAFKRRLIMSLSVPMGATAFI